MRHPRIDYATGSRLRPWSSAWRYLVVVLGALIGWIAMYVFFAYQVQNGAIADSSVIWALAWLDPIVFLVGVALLPLRRRAPATIAIATSALGAVSTMAASGPAMLAAVSNATHRRAWPIVVNGIVYVGALMVYERLTADATDQPLPTWATLLVLVLGFLILVAFGLYIGARRALVASLHERAVEAEHEAALRVAAAQAGERTRIAREMHDVLAHRISLVAMHAGALAYRDDLEPAETRRTAVLVQDNSRRALGELRQVLGVLRADAPGTEPPQPTLAVLPALLDDARQGGATIDAEGMAAAGAALAAEPPEVVSRTAFRIVQESLTNARKHAPGAPVRVRVDGRAGGLLAVEVTNGAALTAPSGAASSGSGLGLAGLAERVELAGGTIDCGPDGRGGFAVRAWLPWDEEDQDD